ncbi:MAG TPA: putative Ig domain-containing protein [Woeseiaceae bacterium]|jgi:hypothetical protein|nr:putative Ig domain-containing protein [Woeseiaceae bacterium]
MQRASFSIGTLSFVLAAVCFSAFSTDAYAAPPWSDPHDKPGKGQGPNKPPTIEGAPSPTAEVDQYYAFQPTASDRDGDDLTFSISNKPVWAAFDTSNGFLSGFPAAENAGTATNDITISVSDGWHTASLAPFSIAVGDAPNAPPTIGGTPPAEVIATESYSFTPTASDPDQDVLMFSVENRPGWASFDTASGRLYGTPGDANVGIYDGIRIAVSDGTATDSTGAFAITVVQTTTGSVTLSWAAPTQNTDGTPLTDLAGYRIYYGLAPGQYDQTLEINGAGVLSTVIDNLTQGTWYFAATAFTTSGVESDLSSEVQKSVL